jgi:hypothetical protein
MSGSYATPIADAPASFARSTAKLREMHEHLSSPGTLRAEHSEIERYLQVDGRELLRLMFDEYLKMLGSAEQRTRVADAGGVERGEVRVGERGLETIFGEVDASRLLYQAPGRDALAPIDALLNLPADHYSHGVRRIVAKETARASFDEVVELMRDYSGAEIAKRQIEQLAARAATDFDAFYELRRRERQATTDLLVISTDGKGVVMRQEDLREETRKRAEASANKVETRLSPGEKADRKRIAQVCTVYSVEPWHRTAADVLHTLRDENTESKRPRPTDKRVWASVAKHYRKMIRQAFEEALLRDPDRRRRWVVLVDGDAKQVKAVKAEAKRAGVEVTIIVDIVHVLEYVWRAGRAIFGGTTRETENWVGDRLLSLLTGRSGGDVARTIRWWAESRRDQIDAAGRKAIKKACGYLANRTRTRMMRYAEALRDGLPIATGVIEGACRYLVKDRMDRTGACWSLHGAEAVLRLRALRASGDFDEYWHFHLAQEKNRNHATRYANAAVPDPLPARKPHLRRIK